MDIFIVICWWFMSLDFFNRGHHVRARSTYHYITCSYTVMSLWLYLIICGHLDSVAYYEKSKNSNYIRLREQKLSIDSEFITIEKSTWWYKTHTILLFVYYFILISFHYYLINISSLFISLKIVDDYIFLIFI